MNDSVFDGSDAVSVVPDLGFSLDGICGVVERLEGHLVGEVVRGEADGIEMSSVAVRALDEHCGCVGREASGVKVDDDDLDVRVGADVQFDLGGLAAVAVLAMASVPEDYDRVRSSPF